MEPLRTNFVFGSDDHLQSLESPFVIPSSKNKNWKAHFEKGLKRQKDGNEKLAEEELSEALKILSASPESSNLDREKAKCFHAMAEIYLTRGSEVLNDAEFCEAIVKCVALFEAERRYKHGGRYEQDDDIDAAILEAERKLVRRAFGPDALNRYDKMRAEKTPNRRRSLKDIRSKLTCDYFPALAKLPDWDSGEEGERCSEIEKIYERIRNDMKYFVAEIFDYCIGIAGATPCNFSIIGLGSMARQEITPYSDLEFAILVADDDDGLSSPKQRGYFRSLTYLVQVEIIRLGETVLPSVAIRSLNDFYGGDPAEDDWFYDRVVPKGFCFDGAMPWACKTPLGRREWRGRPGVEYIMTVDEMLKLQDVRPRTGGGFDDLEPLKTANVFSGACHLFGDEKLTNAYRAKLSSILDDAPRLRAFREQVLAVIENLLETQCVDGLAVSEFGTQQDVKREVYRLTSLLLEQFAKFFGIFEESSWKCIRVMNERRLLTDGGARNLRAALSITAELRLKCYHKHGKQKEALPTVPQVSFVGDAEEGDAAPSPFTSAIVRLYKSLLPLKSVSSQILEEIGKGSDSVEPESLVVDVLRQVDFMDASPSVTATTYLRILQLPKAFACLLSAKDSAEDDGEKVGMLLVLAHCYRMVGKFQEALDCCRHVQASCCTAETDVVDKRVLSQALTLMMDAYVDQGLYQEALKTHEQLAEIREKRNPQSEDLSKENLHFLNSGAVLFIKMKRYREAEEILRNIIERSSDKRKNFNHFMCLNNLSVILLNQDRLTEARNVLKNARDVANEVFGENAAHPYLVRCLINLSQAHYYLGDVEKAKGSLRMALSISSRVHDDELIEPSIVDALLTKAQVYQHYERWDEMFDTLKEAREKCEIIYACHPHPNVARVHLYLGYCEHERGNFAEALECYRDYLKIHESARLESQQDGRDCNTACVLVRIANLAAAHCGDPPYGLSCLEEALDIEEKVHGKGRNHGHLAVCFGSLGYCLIAAKRESEGLEYLCKSLQMFEEISLDENRSYDRAHVTVAKLLGEHSPGKAEKHLRAVEAVLKKSLKDDCHVTLLQINSALLKIFLQTHRTEEGLELAEKQRRMIDVVSSRSGRVDPRQFYQVFHLAAFYEACGRRNTARGMYVDLIRRLEEHVDFNDPKHEYLTRLLWTSEQRVGEIYQADGRFPEAEAAFRRIATSVRRTERPFAIEARHITQWHVASVYMETGRYQQAYDLLVDLINVYENGGGEAAVRGNIISCAYFSRGELFRRCAHFELALQDLEKALKIAERFRGATTRNSMLARANEAYYAKIMNAIGLVHEQTGDAKRALDYYRSCVTSVEGTRATMDAATFHQNVADALKKLGQPGDALAHYEKSLEIRETLHVEDPIREDIATLLYHIAVVQFSEEKPKAAAKTLERLLVLRKELTKKGGCLQNYCAALILKGNCHISQPDEACLAKDAYQEAEKILKQLSSGKPSVDYAVVVSNLGYSCLLLKKWEQAIRELQKALGLKRVLYPQRASPEVGTALRLLATAHLEHEDYEKALGNFQEALEIFEVVRSADDAAECALNIALCHKGLKNIDRTLDSFRKLEKMCEVGPLSDRMRVGVHMEMADTFAEEEHKNDSKALHHMKQAAAILQRIERSEKDEKTLKELQGKISSFDLKS